MKKIITIALLFGATVATAQDFSYLERSNPWNTGVNAAGLRSDSVSMSYAEAYATKTNGGFAAFSESDDSWNAGVETRSIRHFKKISFDGMFSYDYFDGRNMSGSMFTNPGYYPVDLIEFTPGRKIRETYRFMGGLSAPVSEVVTLGLKADFNAQNYAKRKDLRHKNTRLDLDVIPSVLFHFRPLDFGLSFILGKNSERVRAEEIGTTPESYHVFFDKGLMYGNYELWTGSGVHLTESGIQGFPIKENSYGFGAQLRTRHFYTDFEFRYSDGEAGEKGVTWYKYNNYYDRWRMVFDWGEGEYRHFIRTDYLMTDQRNNESIMDKETINGVTNTHIYGSNQVFSRVGYQVAAEYEIHSDRMDFKVRYDYLYSGRSSYLMYPYSPFYSYGTHTLSADARYRIGQFDLTGGLGYMAGVTYKNQPDRLASSSASASEEVGDYQTQLTDYFLLQNEYYTANRIRCSLGVQYNIRQHFYLKLKADYVHGFALTRVAQPNRVAATLAVGYNF